MGRLIFAAILSLDGYIEDRAGSFEWAAPDEEVHAFFNDLQRSIGTYLYGRRMYETMAVWETDPALAEASPVTRDFARTWQAAEKVVVSTTLPAPITSRTRLERRFDPETIRRQVAASAGDVSVGGPGLAAAAFSAGLVDECLLTLVPILVGGGKPGLPSGVTARLRLLDERRFGNGMVFLRYGVGAMPLDGTSAL